MSIYTHARSSVIKAIELDHRFSILKQPESTSPYFHLYDHTLGFSPSD